MFPSNKTNCVALDETKRAYKMLWYKWYIFYLNINFLAFRLCRIVDRIASYAFEQIMPITEPLQNNNLKPKHLF